MSRSALLSRFLQSHWPAFLFSLAVILGPAYALFDSFHYDPAEHHDLTTYLGLANFDFDQSPIRRYRVIVPMLASGIEWLFGSFFARVEPWYFPGGDFPLGISFLLVNSLIMALAGVFVFRLSRAWEASVPAAALGLIAVLSCRWTAYMAGLPLVDSLYFLIVVLVLYALKTGHKKLLILTIFLGPWAKESFLFIAPLIFLFGPVNRWKQTLYFLLSGLLVFAFRYGYDSLLGLPFTESLQADFSHFGIILRSLQRLFSFHGLYEIFSIVGIWGLLLLLPLFLKTFRQKVKPLFSTEILLFLGIVLLHALLSTELARMFYLAMPVLAVLYARIADQLWKELPLKKEA